MGGVLVALASLSVAVSIQRLFLKGRNAKLRAREQAYRFHALRDELQLFVAEGRVETASSTYEFLMTMLNFAIRNAGVARLSELLALTKKVESQIDQPRFEQTFADIQKHDPGVQELAQKFFFAFASMLVSNDWLVRTGVKTRNAIIVGWQTIRPLIKLLDWLATAFFDIITPTRVEAVREASRYRALGRRLNPCE